MLGMGDGCSADGWLIGAREATQRPGACSGWRVFEAGYGGVDVVLEKSGGV